MKKALITGITGQDGSYLAELLLSKNYEVHGVIRRSSSFNTGRIDHIFDKLHLHYGDLSDGRSLENVVRREAPHGGFDEVYNLGAQSHVRTSFDIPEYTGDTVALGTLRLLETIKGTSAKFYQASSSEMFGSSPAPQDESTPFHPRSPYGAAKVYAHNIATNYRESYNMFVCSGILFNHESPRRGETFVTRKITRAVARIKTGRQDKLFLGNLQAKRDWGYAPEYVKGMWRMMQQDDPGDYVLATGYSWSIQDFLAAAFGVAGLYWRNYVEIDPCYYRPAEIDILQGDSSKAYKEFGWKAETMMPELAKIMVKADLQREQDHVVG